MKVKVDSCVYDVGYIDIEKMSVSYTNRSHFETTAKLNKCELLSENFIDDLAIEHVKSTQRKKLEEKHTWDVGERCEKSDAVTVEIVDNVGGMNFMSDRTISQTVSDNKKCADKINAMSNNNSTRKSSTDKIFFDKNSTFTLKKKFIKKSLDSVDKRLDKLSEELSNEDDAVNKPKHYQIGLGEYEMKDVSYALIDHNKLDGREGAVYFNVLKYIGRFNNKGVPIQDLEKAEFYLKELIELTKEKDY